MESQLSSLLCLVSVGINVVLVGLGIKLYSEMVKWKVLEKP